MMPSEHSWQADPWEAGTPVTMATAAGCYCVAQAGCSLNALDLTQLRAHSGLIVGPQCRPALLARIRSSDGRPIGTAARLLLPDKPYDRVPLLRPVRWWGERSGGAVAIAPAAKRQRRWRNVITLAATFDMAIALLGLRDPSQHWALLGLDHLAECDLPANCKVVLVVPPGTDSERDSRLLIEVALKRLRRGRPEGSLRVEPWPAVAAAVAKAE